MSQSLNILKSKIDELPNNIEAEQSVIGSILLTNEIFDEVNLVVKSKYFYDPVHRKIFEALEKLIFSGISNNFKIILKRKIIKYSRIFSKITKFSTSL